MNPIHEINKMSMPFNITLHMVTSFDGMIAKKDNTVSWFETTDVYEKGVVGQDVSKFL